MSNRICDQMETLFDQLWPINRSITGPGFRRSLDLLNEIAPTTRLTFKTGEHVFDWTVPQEWNVNHAYIIDPNGRRIADFEKNNLHLVGYSEPVTQTMTLAELMPRLHSLPDKPDAIPYVTSYFHPSWGFCLKHRDLRDLVPGQYQVVIDSELYDGNLEIGEALIPGTSNKEILWSSYLCHPSMANNELSGPLVLAFLYRYVKSLPQQTFTHRFVFSAETIGTLCYLKERGSHLKKFVAGGYVLTCLGTSDPITYKCSRRGDTLADKLAKTVLRDHGTHKFIPFDPFGSDERQYCSPGFNLPIGTFMRTRPGEYPEYHTSLDDKEFICFESLNESYSVLTQIVDAVENNITWHSTIQFGEPHLSKRTIYPTEISSNSKNNSPQLSIDDLKQLKWLLNLSDGEHDLLTIAERSTYKFSDLSTMAQLLQNADLLRRVDKT